MKDGYVGFGVIFAIMIVLSLVFSIKDGSRGFAMVVNNGTTHGECRAVGKVVKSIALYYPYSDFQWKKLERVWVSPQWKSGINH